MILLVTSELLAFIFKILHHIEWFEVRKVFHELKEQFVVNYRIS